jgi:TolA-binding protein
MARPPGKRRGITLGARADSASALDLLNVQPEASVVTTGNRRGVDSSTAGGDSNATSEGLSEQLSELRRISAELEVLGTTQAEQLRQLGQQRDQIALQIRQLEARGQTPRTSGRLGILLTLLALVGAAAFGFHNWPRLQTLAGDLADVSRDLVQLAPDLRGVRGEVGSLKPGTDEQHR